MKLQVALDFCKNYQNAKNIIDDIEEYVDIIELGTPLLMECGLDIITKIKSDYPEKIILSDLKIMDAGRYETEEALKAGADMVLMPENFEEAYQGVLDAVVDGTVSEERIDDSLRRIYRVKLKSRVL